MHAQGTAGGDHRERIVAEHLGRQPRDERFDLPVVPCRNAQGAGDGARIPPPARHRTEEGEQRPTGALVTPLFPLEGRCLEHKARDETGVTMREIHADGPAHRIPHSNDRAHAKGTQHCRCIVGRTLEPERLAAATSATMSVMVDRHHVIPLAQRSIGVEELRIGARGPAMEQQHRRGRRIGMAVFAHEHFSLTPNRHHASGREPVGEQHEFPAHQLVCASVPTNSRSDSPNAVNRSSKSSLGS